MVPGDKVAIIGENMPNWGVTYFAVTSMGAVAVPVLQEFHTSAVRHILRHSEAKMVVASNRYMEKVDRDDLPGLETVIVMDDFSVVHEDEAQTSFDEAVEAARERFEHFSEAAKRLIDSKVGRRIDEISDKFGQTISGKLDNLKGRMEERLDKISDSMGEKFDKFSSSVGDSFDKLSNRFGKSDEKKDFQLTPDSVAVILYTSGTTGHSKGVVLTHRNLVSNAVGGGGRPSRSSRPTASCPCCPCPTPTSVPWALSFRCFPAARSITCKSRPPRARSCPPCRRSSPRS